MLSYRWSCLPSREDTRGQLMQKLIPIRDCFHNHLREQDCTLEHWVQVHEPLLAEVRAVRELCIYLIPGDTQNGE
jgi:hypothetical protein